MSTPDQPPLVVLSEQGPDTCHAPSTSCCHWTAAILPAPSCMHVHILHHLRMPSSTFLINDMIRYDSHHTPPPETSFRHKAWLASKPAGESHLNVKATNSAKDARRRRVELRRISSLSQALSYADPLNKLNQIPKEAGEVTTSKDLGGGSVRRRSYGKISVVGRRREMEDVVEVKLGFLKRGEESYDFFGIFDGRDQGRMVALARCQMLHQMLAMIVGEETEDEIDWEEVMIEGFDLVEAKINKNGVSAETMVAVVGNNKVVVAAAKCDGSKAVLWRGGERVRLLEDQKDEMRVRVSIVRNRGDEFLILGSNGFWDAISDGLACQVARSYCSDGSGGAEAAAALMAKLAVAQGSRGNISVIVVDLRHQTSLATDGL